MAIDVRGLAPLLQVFDMPTAIRFYRDVLGFAVVETSRPYAAGEDCYDWVLLSLNGVKVMLNTAYESDARPPEPDSSRIAGHEDTGIFFACPNVDAAYAHLRAQGIQLQPPNVAPYGMKQLYVRDPDGFVLCFQWPATRETADA